MLRVGYQIGLLLLAIALPNCHTQAEEPRRVIVDADTANEIDDLYAIVRAIIAPEFDVKGITSAHFTRSSEPNDTVHRSHKVNLEILQAMGLSDSIQCLLGADRSMSAPEQPIDSPAAQWIIEQAHAGGPDDKLIVFALGACTNLASALKLDPSIEPKIIFAFIDGNFRNRTWSRGLFNWRNDIHAVKAIFESNVEYWHMPAPAVSIELEFLKTDVDRYMKGKGGVWDLLVTRWETFPRTAGKEKKTMWDIALIEAVLRPDLATEFIVGAPIIHDVDTIEAFEDNPRKIKVFEAIDAKGMERDFWNAVELAISKENPKE